MKILVILTEAHRRFNAAPRRKGSTAVRRPRRYPRRGERFLGEIIRELARESA